ncbi:DUF5060 domain-containing protein [Chitinophaga pinensis]|uniref:DUF5060 domain-containing protein n=1 Tax=Chitinophaga pinensis (strain ATCC 43595 / DSM 2588 / LMG 13176 / NBRC 15968 / NCIMB 11800 / UQM 2034) TaxID=485918 RepID=A0A979G8P3_CHIPD|nr:DUF5060 domain-containing protein [Chitinophaga pinensis]ACU62820.1 hypothetical protein Cpin_5390 [Chitinophaga pinensis DSM 2588]
MKNYVKAIPCYALLMATFTVYANDSTKLQRITPPAAAVNLYEKAEWTIDLTANYSNPYDQREIKLDMCLVSPSGKPLLLPAYFDQVNHHWQSRFAPQETGQYQYYFELIAGKDTVQSKPSVFTVYKSTRKGFLHKNDLWTFRFDNGELFRGVGENVAWESRSFEDDKWTYDYLLPSLAHNGANFFRTWMCYWNLPLEWKQPRSTKRYQPSAEYFHPGAIRRMDQLVDMCDSLGLYFMLTLDWHGHLMEHGGWKHSSYNKANGGPAETPTAFFTSQQAQEKYKNKLRYIIARWGYSSSIAVWEFFNEVDNAAFTQQDSILIPLPVIAQWHLEMSRYLKDIDPYHHLVSTSISHRDIIGMNAIPYIDFNQKHIYKHTEKIPGIYPDYIQTFGKPYVVGEFGYRWEDQDPKYATEANYDYRRGLWYGMFSPTPVLPMSWWWELFDDQHMTPYLQSVSTINKMMLQAGKGQFEQLPVQAAILESYAIKCGNTIFVYALNNTTKQQSADIRVNIPSGYTLQCFHPLKNTWNKSIYKRTADGTVQISNTVLPAKEEIILVFKP